MAYYTCFRLLLRIEHEQYLLLIYIHATTTYVLVSFTK